MPSDREIPSIETEEVESRGVPSDRGEWGSRKEIEVEGDDHRGVIRKWGPRYRGRSRGVKEEGVKCPHIVNYLEYGSFRSVGFDE